MMTQRDEAQRFLDSKQERESELEHWDRGFREGTYKPRVSPSPLLAESIDRLPRGRALDIACGTGRNTLFLAKHGYQVDAVDGSAAALEIGRDHAMSEGLDVNWIEADLNDYIPIARKYAVVVNCYYLNRKLLPRLADALVDDGYLFLEQHLRTSRQVSGRPEWRLEPNELLRSFGGLRIVDYTERVGADEDSARPGEYATVRMLACNGAGGF